MTIMPLTANDSTADWHAAGWRLTPFNITILDVAPPPMSVKIESVDDEHVGVPGEFRLLPPSGEQVTWGHQPELPLEWGQRLPRSYQMVFEEGLLLYADIWKSLANK